MQKQSTASFKLPVMQASVVGMLINGALFNLSWLAIVMTHSAAIAPAVVVVHLAIHFALFGVTRGELQLVVGMLAAGVVVDQLLFRVGVFSVAGLASAPPVWMTCLWPVLATTLMHAFRGLQGRPLLSSVLGAVSGAASYTAGTRLSDVAFFSELWGPVSLGILWAVLFPLLLFCAAQLQGEKVAS